MDLPKVVIEVGAYSTMLAAPLIGKVGFEVFVRHRFDPKFGGPWDNFLMEAQISTLIVAICGAGYFCSRVALRRKTTVVPEKLALSIGGLAGLATFGLIVSGVVSWFAFAVPFPRSWHILDLASVFFAVGLIFGCLTPAMGFLIHRRRR